MAKCALPHRPAATTGPLIHVIGSTIVKWHLFEARDVFCVSATGSPSPDRAAPRIAMPTDEPRPLHWLTEKLERLHTLDEKDREKLAALPMRLERAPRLHRLVREGDRPDHCCLLVEGFASRYKDLRSGARQIVSFHLRGDLLDIQHLLLSEADHSVETITPALVGWIPMQELLRLVWERPAIGKALWRDCLIDASIFREWVLNVGQRDAKSRIAHMLCEFVVRCEASGLGSPESIVVPITQGHIAEATGLTPVHVNRMLQALRSEGALERGTKNARVADMKLLRSIAGFDPAYLHAAA
jgi:CRP-like cAMP-binding protein